MHGQFWDDSLPESAKVYAEYLSGLSLTPDQIAWIFEPWPETPAETNSGGPLPDAALPWQEWLRLRFPHVTTAPMGDRHARLWEWFEGLRQGERPRPRVEVWPRGGAKSSTAELGTARVCVKLTRRYVLYVSETQEQADKHVQSVASLLEAVGVARAVNQYGTSKGWRRQELRTANGFNVSAYGLDTAARGVKLDQYRPDLVIFDDLDSQDDSAKTIEKKINALTTAIIPAGSFDCAYLFLQNLIHEESIFSMLVDGRADFLHDREAACVEPAVRNLTTEPIDRGDGLKVYRITAGEPTWAGQSLETCERQINDWGLRAFLREAQHEVAGAAGFVFDVGRLNYIEAAAVPVGLRLCRAWDLAATEGGGDWTAGILLGVSGSYPAVRVYVLDVKRGQWSSERVRAQIAECAAGDPAGTSLRLPQDPGQAGKDQAGQFRARFREYNPKIQPASGDKATRARGFAEAINKGNVYLVKDLRWNHAFREELRKFREDENDQVDDQVDAGADAFNLLARGRVVRFN